MKVGLYKNIYLYILTTSPRKNMISLFLFIACYAGFVFFPKYKMWIAVAGAALLVLLQQLSVAAAFKEIHWNVMGLFIGTLFLAELFMYSRVPAVLAEWLVDHAKSVRLALIGIFILASVISMFVENVAVVLLIAPVALALCEKLKISPVNPLILLAMFSNLQGTATLIGDPPSMILGSYMKMTFADFFFYLEKPSIFFVVQTGAFFTLLLSFWLFRQYRQAVKLVNIEKVQSWVPTILLVLLILILAAGSSLDPESTWLAGTTAMVLGLIGLVWHHFGPKWNSTLQIVKTLDWQTTFFLMALFVLVGAIRLAGWMDALAQWIVSSVPAHLLLTYVFIILISLVVSAFIDNVPYLIAMIPVVQQVAEATGFSLPLLIFALLVGACLGGNITPIGASANIVAVSFLQKNGYEITFPYYVRIGLLFTAFAVIPAAIVLWSIWA
jgi:Na+/H+ antiporter NhaD/arsenite permease-like protein